MNSITEYRNHDHMQDIYQLKTSLLLAILPHISQDGWSESAIKKACTDLNVPKAQADLLFPSGPIEMILWFNDYADQNMQKALALENGQLNGLKSKIFRAIQIRLQQNIVYRDAIKKAVGYLLLPWNQKFLFTGLYKTVDSIWLGVNHFPTDFSFYTKRLTLAGIYSSTLLYWLRDTSENYQETWNFLTRRLEDLGKIPVLRQKLMAARHYIPSPIRLWQKLKQHG